MLKLSDKPVIAKGERQHVYAHPDDPTLLVKVPQPGTFDADGHLPDAGWLTRRLRRATMYKGFLREFVAYLELKAEHQDPDARLPISAVHGTVQSDLGLGLVYERISDPDGSLPPSLKELMDSGRLEAWHVTALHTFFDTLIAHHVVVSNKNLKNIIFQTEGPGHGRFVWIDSFGCKQSIPLRKWSKRLNTRRLEDLRRLFVGRAEGALGRGSKA
ncbi:YrbL family protein [uncultured Tateyamaria sp.]|uniref:YrbL family protein n=1 Tax=uncultured Tateyamaria sp. TaxID=455651 RepID=UPI00262EC8F7|nr:YrbL family protein [uncultured Tateyamaria sp.]